jgi:hypothetical protein
VNVKCGWRDLNAAVLAIALLLTSSAVARAEEFKLGAWHVTHKKDQFEETYSISTAVTDQGKKLDLILSCDSGKDFSIAFLGAPKVSYGFPLNDTRALLLIEADDKTPSVPVLTERNRIPFMLNADHASAAEREILAAHKLGIRIKTSDTKHADYFFDMADSTPARSLIMKNCPPSN